MLIIMYLLSNIYLSNTEEATKLHDNVCLQFKERKEKDKLYFF